MHDDFYLAWLARDCRFHCTIYFTPQALLGYSPVRRAIVTSTHEPELQEWLATKNIEHRCIRDRHELRRLLRLLSPVRERVKDRKNMENLIEMLDKPLRGLSHEELFEVFLVF